MFLLIFGLAIFHIWPFQTLKPYAFKEGHESYGVCVSQLGHMTTLQGPPDDPYLLQVTHDFTE